MVDSICLHFSFNFTVSHLLLYLTCIILVRSFFQAVANLKIAFDNGFDNYATVRADPDLALLVGDSDFDALMEKVDSQKGFNPFGFLKK